MNAVLTEFVGTSLLIATISYIGTPIAIAVALFSIVLVGGPISGGHFNPAVTLWAYLSHKISHDKAVLYFIAQLSAGVVVFLSKA
jgi:aquaporin Z